MLLVSTYRDEDLAGWFWSEKIDGFRAFWNGSAFVSRLGNEFDVPAEWLRAMPSHKLDGELFAGSWSDTCSAVRSGRWSDIRFHAFDADVDGGLLDRQQCMEGLPDFCRRVEHAPVFSTEHARAIMSNVAAAGGEGIVLRRPDTSYFSGRSADVLKLKPFNDAEATVVKPLFKTYLTIPSSHLVVDDAGREFKLQRCPRTVQPGDRVTFWFSGQTASGLPRSPQFLRVAA